MKIEVGGISVEVKFGEWPNVTERLALVCDMLAAAATLNVDSKGREADFRQANLHAQLRRAAVELRRVVIK
jgi:hypothetical protein